MRLTSLLDPGRELTGSGSWTPTTDTDSQFDALIPCRSHDPELWFAERTADVEQAKSLCQTCPLIDGCLAGAVDREEPWGVWGGQVFVGGQVVAVKRGRGRPRKNAAPAA